jgi:hypothetical protein
MTRNQLIEEIGKALNIEIRGFYHFKVSNLIVKYYQTEKRNYRIADIHFLTDAEFDDHAQKIADLYKITLKQLKGKNREHHVVAARVHFCRKMRSEYKVTLTSLGKYLNLNHTTICHYLHKYKMFAPNEMILNDRETDPQPSL